MKKTKKQVNERKKYRETVRKSMEKMARRKLKRDVRAGKITPSVYRYYTAIIEEIKEEERKKLRKVI